MPLFAPLAARILDEGKAVGRRRQFFHPDVQTQRSFDGVSTATFDDYLRDNGLFDIYQAASNEQKGNIVASHDAAYAEW